MSTQCGWLPPSQATCSLGRRGGSLHQIAWLSAVSIFTYFTSATRPTRTLLTRLLIGMLVLEGMPSIRWLYRHFLSQVYPQSLNCYYRTCAVAKLDENVFLTTTAKLALELIPDTLRNEPVFLSTDDTIVVKFGKHFEQVSILHDHALHTGKLYVNGHAFVSLMLCVPIMKQHHDKSYIS